jgi:hypothetical protein
MQSVIITLATLTPPEDKSPRDVIMLEVIHRLLRRKNPRRVIRSYSKARS